jgi:hypothetical protein
VKRTVESTVRALALLAAFWAVSAVACVSAQETDPYAFSARVWLDRGDEPLLQAGDRVRIYYRTSEDAHVAIFQVNTDGFTRLVYPRSPQENSFVRGGRDYRLLLPQSPYWYVDDAPGVGYFFIVATREPLDFASFPYSFSSGGWDLSFVGQHVYTDPFLAMDDYVAALVPAWETVEYGLDFLTYHVGQIHDYPRFLCYDCHGYQPYYAWNPYYYSCTSFRLVIWDDPYYYPVYRYSGTRVVYTRPPAPGYNPRFSFKERADGEPTTPEVVRRSSAGSGNASVPPRGTAPGDAPSAQGRATTAPGAGGAAAGSADRRPSAGSSGAGSRIPNLPGVIPGGAAGRPSGRAQTLSPGNGRSSRPVLERRPTVPTARTGGSGSQGVPSRPSARVRTGGDGSAPATGSSAGRPTTSSSGTSGSVPSRVRTSGSGGAGRPAAQPSRPTVKTGTSGSARPTVRPKTGGSGSTRPAVRPKTGGGSSRPAVKPKSGGGSPRPAVKPKGSGGGQTAARARTSGGTSSPRPAPRPKGTGGSAP